MLIFYLFFTADTTSNGNVGLNLPTMSITLPTNAKPEPHNLEISALNCPFNRSFAISLNKLKKNEKQNYLSKYRETRFDWRAIL